MFSSGSNSVRRNHIFDSPRVGVSIAGPSARGDHIEKYVIAGNDVGVMIRPVYVQRTRVSMNHIRDNRSAGIDMRVRADWADGSDISQNVVHRNGFAPSTNSAADGLRVEISPGVGEVVVSRNKAIHNAGVGINVSGVIDGGGNIAKQNVDPVNVSVSCADAVARSDSPPARLPAEPTAVAPTGRARPRARRGHRQGVRRSPIGLLAWRSGTSGRPGTGAPPRRRRGRHGSGVPGHW